MDEEGLKELKKINSYRLWLLAFAIVMLITYGLVYFFTTWGFVVEAQFKAIAIILALNVIVYFALQPFFEKKPTESLEISVFSLALVLLPLIDYFGGPFSVAGSILFVATVISFVYKRFWGILTTAISFLYIIVYGFWFKGNIATNLFSYFYLITILAISALVGHIIFKRNEELEKENKSIKRVADKLTAEKSQDEAVLSAIADGVYAVDRDRNLVLLNKAAQEMVGWEEKDALGIKCKTVMKLLTGDNDISVCEKDCPALAVWNTGKPVFRNDTCFIHRVTKNRVQLSSSYAPIKDMEGNMVGAICVFRDVTKEKELERQRNEFVSTASHELRTPITATEGYLSIITDSGMCKVDNNAKEYLKKARNTLLGMSNLVKNLLAVTKIDEGKLELNITNFPIVDLIEEVMEIFLPKAKEKGITLEFVKSQKLSTGSKKAIARSLKVRADREMIREVLNNLVENAIKFTKKGGVKISIDYNEDFAQINIKDTGIGMPKEAQKHLFEKFYRVDNSATREIGGTGLGLYITRAIVEQFGGKIWVESAKGKGSEFHFTVPLALDS